MWAPPRRRWWRVTEDPRFADIDTYMRKDRKIRTVPQSRDGTVGLGKIKPLLLKVLLYCGSILIPLVTLAMCSPPTHMTTPSGWRACCLLRESKGVQTKIDKVAQRDTNHVCVCNPAWVECVNAKCRELRPSTFLYSSNSFLRPLQIRAASGIDIGRLSSI